MSDVSRAPGAVVSGVRRGLTAREGVMNAGRGAMESMLFEMCRVCEGSRGVDSRCPGCGGKGFVPTGVTTEQIEMLARHSPDKARLMRGALRRIEEAPAFFGETLALVNEARATLDAVGR